MTATPKGRARPMKRMSGPVAASAIRLQRPAVVGDRRYRSAWTTVAMRRRPKMPSLHTMLCVRTRSVPKAMPPPTSASPVDWVRWPTRMVIHAIVIAIVSAPNHRAACRLSRPVDPPTAAMTAGYNGGKCVTTVRSPRSIRVGYGSP